MYIDQTRLDGEIKHYTRINNVIANAKTALASVQIAQLQEAGPAENSFEKQQRNFIHSQDIEQATDFSFEVVSNTNNRNAVKTTACVHKYFADPQEKEYEQNGLIEDYNCAYSNKIKFLEANTNNESDYKNFNGNYSIEPKISLKRKYSEVLQEHTNPPTNRCRTRRPLPDAIDLKPHLPTNEADESWIIKDPIIVKRILNGNSIDLKQRCIESSHVYQIATDEFDESFNIKPLQDNIKESQMGIDIYTRLRRLLHLDSSANHDLQEVNRKRRSEDRIPDVYNPHLIKYRRVENRFPKFLARNLEDDRLDAKNLIPSKYQKYMNTDMQRPEKQNQRKSMFAVPKSTLVKNTIYADLEFSDDDDEPQIVKDFGLNTIASNNRNFSTPLSQAERALITANQMSPPKTTKRAGKVLGSSMASEFGTTSKLTYAEMLRQQCRTQSEARSSTSMQDFNMQRHPWAKATPSAAKLEIDGTERDRYQQLLEQVMPRIYGSANYNTQLPKVAHYVDENRQSTLLADNHCSSSVFSTRCKTSTTRSDKRKTLQQSTLLSTIYLDDDDDVLVKQVPPKRKNNIATTIILDDDDDNDEISELVCDDAQQASSDCNMHTENKDIDELPNIERVNSLYEQFKTSPHMKDNWLEMWQSKWKLQRKARKEEVNNTEKVAEKRTEDRRAAELELHDQFKDFNIYDRELIVIDDFPKPEPEEEEPEIIQLTPEQKAQIKTATFGPSDQVLISKFNLNISRRDIQTLHGHNWLNDEVINFYMSLLTERGERKHESHGLPRVYAMNTFFIPRLMQAGHSGVKRWTRKVDIFSKDVIPVPVHVGGVHWCMAIIHLKNRTILYYDSMGTPNPNVLKALENYLKEESMDKRKQPFDTTDFEIESVRNVPRQMNGSDCGVFSCMFAEYITRNKPITFSQENMEYFREKMVLEIVRGELLR